MRAIPALPSIWVNRCYNLNNWHWRRKRYIIRKWICIVWSNWKPWMLASNICVHGLRLCIWLGNLPPPTPRTCVWCPAINPHPSPRAIYVEQTRGKYAKSNIYIGGWWINMNISSNGKTLMNIPDALKVNCRELDYDTQNTHRCTHITGCQLPWETWRSSRRYRRSKGTLRTSQSGCVHVLESMSYYSLIRCRSS